MPLETGDFISDLVETNPLGSDNVSQGDDHLRLIKHVLKSTFPNLDCAVTATCDDLNNAGKSSIPKVTTYLTPATAQTHNFEAGTSWVRIYVTGGGAGGGNSDVTANGGGGGATAIRCVSVGATTSMTYTVGGGGAAGGVSGGDSSAVINGLTTYAQGGVYTTDSNTIGVGATGGNINIRGSAGHAYSGRDAATQGVGGPGMGGSTYWGGAMNNRNSAGGAYGTGGRGRTFSETASAGVAGVVMIEEY